MLKHVFYCSESIQLQLDIIIAVPAVTSVILSAISPTPTHPNGSLTCIVRAELSSEVDTPVTVNTVLTDPAGFKAMNTLQPAIGDIMTYTTTAIISSLDRNQSGDYNCTATLDPLLNNTYIISSTTKWDSVQVIMGEACRNHKLHSAKHGQLCTVLTSGVHLALRNQFIANGSQINIRSIGQSSDNPNSALQCITDLTESCCGQWYMYLPNGARVQVGNNSPTTAFYRSSGNNGEVFLNRPSEVTSPTGQFCCATTNAAYRYQTLCVTIGIM